MRLSVLPVLGVVFLGFLLQLRAQQAPVPSNPATAQPTVTASTAAAPAAAPITETQKNVAMPVSQPNQAPSTPAQTTLQPVATPQSAVTQAQPQMPGATSQPVQASSAVVPITQPSVVATPVVTAPQSQPQAQAPVQVQPVQQTVIPASQPAAPVVTPPAQQTQATLTMPVQIPVAAQPPQKSAAQERPTPQIPEDDTQGINTLDIDEPQGNWLYKRLWWQRAEQQYEKTKGLVDAIMEARMGFFSRRTELDRAILDPFYLDVGLSRGNLEEIIETLVEKSKESREKHGALKPEERAFLELIEAEKNNLEQLQKDIQKISDVDHSIDDAIDVLIKQINQARNFERQSWRNFKQIAQELNDKKARELYYGMVTYFQNINDIGGYIQGPLAQHFNQLEALVKEQVNKVQQAMKTLKEKGVDFKKQSHQFDESSKAECPVEAEKVQEQPKSFFAKSWAMVSGGVSTSLGFVWSGIKKVWDVTIGRFFAPKKQEVVIPSAPQVPAPTPEHTQDVEKNVHEAKV